MLFKEVIHSVKLKLFQKLKPYLNNLIIKIELYFFKIALK